MVTTICSNVQFQGKHHIPIRDCNLWLEVAFDNTVIVVDEVDNCLVDYSLNYLC